MRLAITDACIFIDLVQYNLVHHFFELNLEIHTSYEVWEELGGHHHQVLMAYKQVGKLSVHSLSAEEFEAIQSMPLPKGLSFQDKSVIFLAQKLEAMILSSDNLLRKTVGKRIEVHGLLWILEQLVLQGKIAPPEASKLLDTLYRENLYYFNNEQLKEHVEGLLKQWNKA